MKLILKIGLGSIALILLAWLMTPRVERSRKKADQTQATNNARQIGMALFDFESEYERFPNEASIADVKGATGSNWELKSETSNDLFKQLIVVGITQSEEMFYAKGPGARRADNNINTEARTLEPGECGFAYLPPQGSIEELDSARPLALAPLIPGTLRFDPKPFDGKAVVLRADNSVISCAISKDGRAIVAGRDLFDPSQSFWRGKPPVVKWPALLPESTIAKTVWMGVGIIGGLIGFALIVFFVRYKGPIRPVETNPTSRG